MKRAVASFTMPEDCSICLDSMDKLDSVNLQGCGHALHYDCMSTLLGYQENTPCPMCRKPIEHDMLLDCNPSDFNARCHESAYEIEYGPQIMEVVARAGSATGGSKKKKNWRSSTSASLN